MYAPSPCGGAICGGGGTGRGCSCWCGHGRGGCSGCGVAARLRPLRSRAACGCWAAPPAQGDQQGDSDLMYLTGHLVGLRQQ
jgi:hypothetical protein